MCKCAVRGLHLRQALLIPVCLVWPSCRPLPCRFFASCVTMVLCSVTVHPNGLSLQEAAKAWYLRVHEKKKWIDIKPMVHNLQGKTPSLKAIRNSVALMTRSAPGGVPQTKYSNCGRKRALTPKQEQLILAFVRKWRHKVFCTCRYMRLELKLDVQVSTIRRTLNKHGLFWRPVAKKSPLTMEQLAARKTFVNKYGAHSSEWWLRNIGLVFDGVTLSKAPRSLSGRQKHAAQSLRHMWMQKSEKMDPSLLTLNRYGIQLGDKVPLWGGFTGEGQFTLRLWTRRPKLTRPEWTRHVPALKRAAMAPPQARTIRSKIWHDNEGFLIVPAAYKRCGLQSVRFPPNSGDLNPIETVWARLRYDLGKREREDLKAGRSLSTRHFKQRVAQILQTYSIPKQGERWNYYQRLLRGMPTRLVKCRANKFGPCGK